MHIIEVEAKEQKVNRFFGSLPNCQANNRPSRICEGVPHMGGMVGMIENDSQQCSRISRDVFLNVK